MATLPRSLVPLGARKIESGADGGEEKLVYAAVTGNCQAMFVASALGTIPGFSAGCFGKEVRYNPVDGYSAETYSGALLAEILRKKKEQGYHVILCEQTWHRFDLADLTKLTGLVDDVVRFPFIHNYGLWPEVATVEKLGVAAAAIQMQRADQEALAANDNMADVKMLEFFNENFEDKLLYDTPRHPSPIMLAELVRQIGRSAAFSNFKVDAVLLGARVAASRGINTVFNHPVDDSIVNALGCRWARTPAYTAYRECARAMAARDYANASMLLEAFIDEEGGDPFFRRMILPWAMRHLATARTALGDVDGGDFLREKVIELDPFNPLWRMVHAKILLLRKDAERAQATLAGALKLNARDPILRRMCAQAAVDLGDIDGAIEHFEEASKSVPEGPNRQRLIIGSELGRSLRTIKFAAEMIERNEITGGFTGIFHELTQHADDIRELMRGL